QFADAISRALRAAERVNRHAADDDHVTQFELLTAAAYSELARQGVDAAVIEAGLGGHYDATNVIPSKVTVLTNVGLEHTRWLGPTVEAIAREKLDVLQPGTTLILGPGMHPDAVAVGQQIAAERNAALVFAGDDPHTHVAAMGGFQRRNFAVAQTAAQQFMTALGAGALDPVAVSAAGADVQVPGRLQAVDEKPLTLLDGAHNPDGIKAVAESLDELSNSTKGTRVAVVSILDDKDASGMLAALAPHFDKFVFTSSHNPRALPPPTLESLMHQCSDTPTQSVRDPHAALQRGRELAGGSGLVLATGSIYLVAHLLRSPGATTRRHASRM
ncbi:MAG: hypothetical protein J2O48_13265, partial [Solirubrobacterales bacterium]|nr:hypothetical protein [Solirubrobacterales bacterium]